jgi:hypothetical protein
MEKRDKLIGCIPIGGQGRLLQKVAQLCVSFVWTAIDLQEAAVAAPGTGTLLIGAFACILQLLLVGFDAQAAWLTERLNKEETEKKERESNTAPRIQVAHSHENLPAPPNNSLDPALLRLICYVDHREGSALSSSASFMLPTIISA